jgi:hypothetical protein
MAIYKLFDWRTDMNKRSSLKLKPPGASSTGSQFNSPEKSSLNILLPGLDARFGAGASDGIGVNVEVGRRVGKATVTVGELGVTVAGISAGTWITPQPEVRMIKTKRESTVSRKENISIDL